MTVELTGEAWAQIRHDYEHTDRPVEEICAEQDLTSSQEVRRLIHQYIIEHAGSRDLPEWLSGPAAGPGKTPQ